MATNLPPFFFLQFLEQPLKFLVNFTLLKYVKSQRSYGFLITKELIFGFQIFDLKDHFSASLTCFPSTKSLISKDKSVHFCFLLLVLHVSYTDEIIILLNFIFTGLYSYQITPGLSTNKQRHSLLLLKTGIHVAPTHLEVMLSFDNILMD